MTQVLFVHGMGRTSLSGWLLLRQLRRAGLQTTSFDYCVSLESFARIAHRLTATMADLLARDDLALVGHSLGGVLLRDALCALPSGSRPPRHLFLLGSPVIPSRMAQRMSRHLLFRIATRDCGRLLGSSELMSAICKPSVPTTGIAGTQGIVGLRSHFGAEPNDGVVGLSEVSAGWLKDQALVPVIHTLLPSSSRVGAVILHRLGYIEI